MAKSKTSAKSKTTAKAPAKKTVPTFKLLPTQINYDFDSMCAEFEPIQDKFIKIMMTSDSLEDAVFKNPDVNELYLKVCELEKQLKQIEKEAKKGNVKAQLFMMQAHLRGGLIDGDERKGFALALKLAKQGITMAQSYAASCYEEGFGTEQDDEQYLYWTTKAAEGGDSHCQQNLGVIYRFGLHDQPKDLKASFKWFLLAAEQDLIQAQLSVSIMYKNGWGVRKNGKQAFFWAQKAVEHKDSDALCLFLMASMYYYGIGVEQDLKEAARWCKMSADAGSYNGNFQMGLLYKNGEGVKQSYRQARSYFKKAFEQGVYDAGIEISLMYASGCGVKANPKKATEWLTTSMANKLFHGDKKAGFEYMDESYGQVVID